MQKNLDVFRAWLVERELSENTIDSYVYTMRCFFDTHSEVTKENLLCFKSELIRSGKSPQTVNLRLCAVNAWCRMTGSDIHIKKVKQQKRLSVENVITEEEYQRLLDGLSGDENWRWYWNIRLLAATGARVSEAIRITKSDFNRGIAEMWTKGKVRRIYIASSFREDAAAWYEQLCDRDTLMRGKNGAVTTRGVAQQLQNFAERYGIDRSHMHPHAFRHRFAINFLKRNNDLTLLADVMGHSSVSTTAIYTRLTQAEQIEKINQTINW